MSNETWGVVLVTREGFEQRLTVEVSGGGYTDWSATVMVASGRRSYGSGWDATKAVLEAAMEVADANHLALRRILPPEQHAAELATIRSALNETA